MRDSKQYGYIKFKCISCGEPKFVSEADAGHFIGRSCSPLRYNEMNVNAECKACNRFDSSHLLGYRRNLIIKLGEDAISGSAIAQSLEPQKKLALIKKLGEKRVEALEAQKHNSYKWSVEELKEMYAYYAALVIKMKHEQ